MRVYGGLGAILVKCIVVDALLKVCGEAIIVASVAIGGNVGEGVKRKEYASAKKG